MSRLPANSQIVLLTPHPPHPRGALATVAHTHEADENTILIRFLDGSTAHIPRAQLTLKAHYTDPTHGADTDTDDLFHTLKHHVILSTIIGSHAYGLAHAESDVDRRGCFLPPAELHWSLAGAPDSIHDPETDTLFWELQRFLELALKSNPLHLETLFSPIVEHITPMGQQLLDLRPAFLSRLAYTTYTGYALSSWRSLSRAHKRHPDGVNFKHAMHLVRLLLAARHLVRHAALPVTLEPADRQHLLDIRHAKTTFSHVDTTRQRLLTDIEDALPTSPLPERPDTRAVEDFLIRARRAAL